MPSSGRAIAGFIGRNVPIHVIQLITGILPNCSWSARVRGFLVGPFLGHCGGGFMLGSGVVLGKPGKLAVGHGVYIAHYTYINANGGLFLDDGVAIGPMCVLATSNHKRRNGRVSFESEDHEIHVGAGTWLGAHVTLTSGVHVGAGVVVGAGSVVTRDVQDNVLVAGSPAKVIRHL